MKLEVDKADFATVCKAIGRLPNLCELTIDKLATNSPIEDSSLFANADPMLAWGERLAVITLGSLDKCPLEAGIRGIKALLLHAGALEKLEVPHSAKQHVVAIVETHRDRYRHLANVPLIVNDTEILLE
ncbi:hypothetical protein GGH13_002348 [Coemansia sp. S155-1]|nr:hypothetical protein GGH13_002348 [Coemansia sp. S155-1]